MMVFVKRNTKAKDMQSSLQKNYSPSDSSEEQLFLQQMQWLITTPDTFHWKKKKKKTLSIIHKIIDELAITRLFHRIGSCVYRLHNNNKSLLHSLQFHVLLTLLVQQYLLQGSYCLLGELGKPIRNIKKQGRHE